MEDQLVIGLVSVIGTGLVSLLKRAGWSTRVKVAVAVLVSLAGGAAVAWQQGNLDVANTVPAFTAVFTASNLIYQFVLRHSKTDATLEAFGDKSSE